MEREKRDQAAATKLAILTIISNFMELYERRTTMFVEEMMKMKEIPSPSQAIGAMKALTFGCWSDAVRATVEQVIAGLVPAKTIPANVAEIQHCSPLDKPSDNPDNESTVAITRLH